ncbi:MAG: helix-turn-helix domain-containing protein [Clostridium sp.]|nr:helix-turn-helix domain-containing protein [Clostridium sp.]
MKTDLLGTDEVAAELKKSRQFVQGEIRKKKLKAVKVGREFKVSRKDLNLYMGVDNSLEQLKQEIYIKELEAKVKHLEFVLNAVRSNLQNLSDVVEKI